MHKGKVTQQEPECGCHFSPAMYLCPLISGSLLSQFFENPESSVYSHASSGEEELLN